MPRNRKRKAQAGKSILSAFTRDFLSLVLSVLEENKESLAKKFYGFVNFQKRLRRYVFVSVALIAAIVVTLDGISSFLGSFFPGLMPGTTSILLGIIVILFVLAYEKSG